MDTAALILLLLGTSPQPSTLDNVTAAPQIMAPLTYDYDAKPEEIENLNPPPALILVRAPIDICAEVE